MNTRAGTIAFLDCFSGVAGDMWVGALIDLGLSLDALRGPVASLGLPGIELRAGEVERAGLRGTRFEVHCGEVDAPHRHLDDILRILDAGDLPDKVRDRSRRVFELLGEVEAGVHGVPVDHVHFHEVGAADTIVDVVCAVLGGHLLGIERYYASAVVTGSGTVRCEHGVMPVPAPGAMGNLFGIPIRSGGPAGECVTPTGAALLRVLVDAFEPALTWVPARSGYGAGARDPAERPNLLRITLGHPSGDRATDATPLAVCEVTCNLDTITGEGVAYLIDGALARGAVDAFATAVQMKKGRPGFQFTALVPDAARDAIVEFLLSESTSLGVRFHRVERSVLERWEGVVETDCGPVRFKYARLPGGEIVRRPEESEVLRLVAAGHGTRREVLARLERQA